MKRNLRVVQINGFRGLFFTFFIISCLIAGFIAFPSFLAMNAWNYLAVKTGSFPIINFFQSVLLWAIITFSIFIFNKRKFLISFSSKQELSDDEVKEVITKIKEQTINNNILLPKDFHIVEKENKDNIEVSSEQNKIE